MQFRFYKIDPENKKIRKIQLFSDGYLCGMNLLDDQDELIARFGDIEDDDDEDEGLTRQLVEFAENEKIIGLKYKTDDLNPDSRIANLQFMVSKPVADSQTDFEITYKSPLVGLTYQFPTAEQLQEAQEQNQIGNLELSDVLFKSDLNLYSFKLNNGWQAEL